MFTTISSLQNGAAINTEVCVIGAGAAGITIAQELSGQPFRVALLESGGLSFDEQTQSLYAGQSIGRTYEDLTVSRLRYFGGTTNHWGGYCRELDDLDFRQRSWVPFSGWPIRKSDLAPFATKARELCEITPFDFDGVGWAKRLNQRLLPTDPRNLAHYVSQIGPPTRFGSRYRHDLEQSKNITVYLNANAVELETNEAVDKITRLSVADLSGKRFAVHAKIYVLACGAIENARILLLFNEAQVAGGGPLKGPVGQFFMDHVAVKLATVALTDPKETLAFYEGQEYDRRTRVQGVIRPTAQLQEKEGLLNLMFKFLPFSLGQRSLWALIADVEDLRPSAQFALHLGRVICDIDHIVSNYGDKLLVRHEPLSMATVRATLEPSPNPESRVLLSHDLDKLGMRRVKLDWQLGLAEWRTARRATEILAREFGRTGIGRVRVHLSENDEEWPGDLEWAYHQCGTTRMHDSPDEGVVDRDCRVYGLSNLYVAGSSVFPTIGCATPTLTIIMLALRLADHLKGLMVR